MKRAIKKKSNLYTYLDSVKVLEIGSDSAIVQARKEYWRKYKAEWRKQQRQTTRQYVIALNDDEYKQIVSAAKNHKRSCTTYLKESVLCYVSKTYLVPDAVALGTIRQLLAMNYNMLQKLFNKNTIPFEIGRQLLFQMSELEKKIIAELYHPHEIQNQGS